MPAPARLVPPAARRAVVALTALLALLAIAAAPAGASPWGAPEDVSIPGGGAAGSKVGIDAAGNATAVWTRSDGSHFLAQAAERPVGGSWGAPIDLSASTGEAESMTLAVDPAGDVVVAWQERTGASWAIEASYKPAGGIWTGPAVVQSGLATVETPAVAIDAAGDAVVIWRQNIGGNHVIYAASMFAGGPWDSPTPISSSALNADAPDVTMSANGTAAAVWQSSSGATSVVESSALPLGGVWDAETAVSAPATVTEPPKVVADPSTGGFTAIWSRSSVGLVAEVASLSASGVWSVPEPISTLGAEAHVPQLAVDSAGDAVAAWYRFDGSVGTVEAVELVAGGSWTPPVRVSPLNAEDAEAPQVAMSPAGAAQVVWDAWNPDTHNYVTRTSRLLADDTWQDSKQLSLDGEQAYGPHVALDHSDHSVVVWNGEVSLGGEIMSSFRQDTTWLVVTRAGSGSGTVTSAAAGIGCGTTCTAAFPEESTVSLTADAAAGSSFAGWSGACSGTGACTVTIGADQSSVGAEFVSTPRGGGTDEPGAGGVSAVPGAGDTGTTTTPTTSTSPAPQAPPLKIVPACTSRRVMVIHWRVRRGIHLRSVVVRLDGIIYRSLPGAARSAKISLLGRPQGAVAIRIEGIAAHGRRYAAQRSYNPCVSNRSHDTLGNNALKR